MTATRRRFLAAAGACGLAATAGWAAAEGEAKVILLGTRGGPRVNKGPANPANLVVAGGRSYVVDCGYGVTRQLVNAGVEAHDVRTILITHNHSDHMLELGPLIYSAWAGGLREPIDVWGPPPLAAALPAFMEYMAFDIDTRIADEGRPDLRKFVRVHEFEAHGPVFEAPDLKVSAVRVRHPPITNAYAYRFDTPGRSIVLSGDTTYSPELIALAKGADVLVHEVMHLGGLERLLARVPERDDAALASPREPYHHRAARRGRRGGSGEEAGAQPLRAGRRSRHHRRHVDRRRRQALFRRDRSRPRPHDGLMR